MRSRPFALSMILLVAGFTACAPAVAKLDATHPANPNAAVGRLAGPPPALRAGVAGPLDGAVPAEPDAPEQPERDGQGHDHGGGS
jgi:hypothetical protein